MKTERLVRIVAAVALAAAAAGAAAYVRETTTPGSPGTGYCLWWGGRHVPYTVNATSAVTVSGASAPCLDPELARTTVDAAMATWGGARHAPGDAAACTDFAFVPTAVPTTASTRVGNDGVNLVVFRAGYCSSVVPAGDACRSSLPDWGPCATKWNCWANSLGTIGLTTTTFDPATGQISDSDVELWSYGGTGGSSGFYFTCVDAPTKCGTPPYGVTDPTCWWTDVGSVVTHESGHMLGLDHVCDTTYGVAPQYAACPDAAAVMRPNVDDPARRVLSPDDVSGICTMYPRGQATLTCAPPKKKSSGGCSSAGGAGVAGLLALLVVARPRRRRLG